MQVVQVAKSDDLIMDEQTTYVSEPVAEDRRRAIHALRVAHRAEPQHGETVNDPH